MKIAFVHDWIVYEGGAEAVLKDLISSRNFDDGKVFVLFSTHKELPITNYKLQIVTALPSRLNTIFVYFNTRKVPVLSTLFDYRNLMFWFPLLCWMLRKKINHYKSDEIIISSFAAAKNVVPTSAQRFLDSTSLRSKGQNNKPKVTLYLHSPMQYIWENYKENIQKLSFPIKQLYQFATLYLRPRDKKYRHYDTVLCNSRYTAQLAKHLYGLEGQVVFPSIDKAFFEESISDNTKDYLVFVGRVQKYVREIGTVIEACNQTNTPLIVIGDGPDMVYAKNIAGPTIIFVGRIDNVHEKIAIMKHARGLINIAKESFGMGTIEALCLGVPVIGLRGGATPELIDNTNGVLISHNSTLGHTDKIIKTIEGIESFFQLDFDRIGIATAARNTYKKTL